MPARHRQTAMTRRTRRAPGRVVASALLAVSAAACGSGEPAATTTASSASPRPGVAAAQIRTSIEERCRFAADGEIVGVPADGDSTLAVARLGAGRTAVVLLPQASDGMCGALPYAGWLADHDLAAVSADLCGDGDSRCGPDVSGDLGKQVAALVTWSREELRAERVVVVGGAAGGSIALAVAQDAGADAVVDLSGPANLSGVPDAEEAAKATTIPLLIMCAEADQGSHPARLRAAVTGSPARIKRYVEASGGHGYTMLSRDATTESPPSAEGRLLLDWVRSPTS